MTSINSTNYGSIHIWDDWDQPRGEREETGGLDEELLPQQQESWKSRHKQFIGEIMVNTTLTQTLE